MNYGNVVFATTGDENKTLEANPQEMSSPVEQNDERKKLVLSIEFEI